MSSEADHRPALGAHRLVGEGRGAALIRIDGEIDWWCPGRFDAEPVLWSLLDQHGASSAWRDARPVTWNACPAGPTAHTVVRVGDDEVALWDGLVDVGSTGLLVRLVRARSAPVELRNRLRIGGFESDDRWTFDGERPRVGGLALWSDTWEANDAGTDWLDVRVVATPDRWNGFAVGSQDGAVAGDDLADLLAAAEDRDERRMRRIRLPRRHASRATDALRVLNGLTDCRTGAPVAAATTSLPEAIGGDRQFDYRYSWLRDSALAVTTAVLLGHLAAAERYLDFVADLVERRGEHLTPLTTATGDGIPDERCVDGIAGWAASTPIRVGNAAVEQRQLDSIAVLLDAVTTYALGGGRVSTRLLDTVERLANLLADAETGPTNGIWELRDAVPLVSEELSRWQGLDQALRLYRHRRPWRRRPAWRRSREEARARVEGTWRPDLGRLPQVLDAADTTPDAATLVAALCGFWPRHDSRVAQHVRNTVAALEEGAFLRRYPPADDGFVGVEGAFLPASWWAVSALAVIGDVDAAQERADEMCRALPPLLPECWDVESNDGRGNTPLLWSHMEAARALYTLDREKLRRRLGSAGVSVVATLRTLRLRVGRRRRGR